MTRNEDSLEGKEFALKVIYAIVIGVICLIVLISFFGMFYVIDAGQGGVLLTFGKASDNPIQPGLHFKVPIVQTIVKFETKTQKYEADATAASSDLQTVTAKLATNYYLQMNSLPTIYRTLGRDYETRIIHPLEQEVVKAVTAKYTAEELITRREEVRAEIKEVMTERLVHRGIIVEEVSIINFDFSNSFNEAIELKVVSQQQKLKADIDLQRIRIEAEQKIASAQAEAESLRLQKQQVTAELVQLRQIEVQSKSLDVQKEAIAKWNGIMPTTVVTGGDKGIFSILQSTTTA